MQSLLRLLRILVVGRRVQDEIRVPSFRGLIPGIPGNNFIQSKMLKNVRRRSIEEKNFHCKYKYKTTVCNFLYFEDFETSINRFLLLLSIKA